MVRTLCAALPTDKRSCGELGDVKVRGACCETRLVALVNATSSCLSILPFANGPKRPMGHVLGAKKGNFLNSRPRAPYGLGRCLPGAVRVCSRAATVEYLVPVDDYDEL